MLDPAVIGAGVGTKMADVRAVIDRQAAFVFDAEAEPAPVQSEGRSSARDFVLRVMAAVVDPVNYSVLRHLSGDDASMGELGKHLELGQVATWERINDLVQVGIVGHDLEQDRVGLTIVGSQFVDFVEAAAGAADLCTEPADA